MQLVIVVVFIGVIGGVAVGFQGPLTSLMSQRLGVMESIFIVHLGGAIAAGLPLLFNGGGRLEAWRGVPWYALGAGALGLVVLGAISYTIPRLGIAATITLVVVGQLTVGAISDLNSQFSILNKSLDSQSRSLLSIIFCRCKSLRRYYDPMR